MFLSEFPIGAHVEFNKNMLNTFNHATDYGMYAFQVFLGSSHSYKRSRLKEEDIKMTKKMGSRFPMSIFSHAPYIYNLNGSKSSLAWNGDLEIDKKVQTMIEELEYETGVIAQISSGRSGVVIHPGNYTNRDVGLKTIASTINRINFGEGAKLILENSAGGGTSLMTTIEEMKKIYEHIDLSKRENIGFCLDTCHIHSYGEYDLSDWHEVERLIATFDKEIGLKNLTLFHLNDSHTEKGSRVDRHHYIGSGSIWGGGKESLDYLLTKCKESGIPLILETHESDMLNFLK